MHGCWRRAAICLLVLCTGAALSAAGSIDEAMAQEEAFWAARSAGDVSKVEELLAPGYSSVDSDCNGLHVMEGARAAARDLSDRLAGGRFGSYKLRRMNAQVVGQAVILTVGWQDRYQPRVGGVRAIVYTSGVSTVVWAQDAQGHWKRHYHHSHWRRIHRRLGDEPPKP